MSYDIELCDPVTHEVIELDAPHFMQDGPDAAGRNMERGLARNLNVGFQKTEYRMETSTCKRNGLRFSYCSKLF